MALIRQFVKTREGAWAPSLVWPISGRTREGAAAPSLVCPGPRTSAHKRAAEADSEAGSVCWGKDDGRRLDVPCSSCTALIYRLHEPPQAEDIFPCTSFMHLIEPSSDWVYISLNVIHVP